MWSPTSCKKEGVDIDCEHGYDFFHDTATPLPNSSFGGLNTSFHGTHVA
jgi:hypothetical protein